MRLELDGIRKVYGKKIALDGISLAVAPGEFVGLTGPNGAGKSTLLKILSGQLLPTSGTAKVDGIDVGLNPDGAREKMGLVPEEPALYEYLTAREFLEFVVGVRGRGDLQEALELAALEGAEDRLIREYSQGMRRRTALAAAAVSRPSVLILDEATNGLDTVSARRVEAWLKKRCEEGAAVLLSTHNERDLRQVATRVVRLEAGKIVSDLRAPFPPL